MFIPLKQHNTYFTIPFIAIYCYLSARFLSSYILIDFIVATAFVASLYIVNPINLHRGSNKYLLFSVLFLVFTVISAVKTFYFLSIGFGVLFVIESMLGSIGYLPLYLLGLLSPTFRYFNNMLGFPVRLQLSKWAGSILQSIGYKNEVAGNIILLNGTEFSVDPACVGLKMIAFSLLAGLLIMAYFQRSSKKMFGFLTATGIFTIIIILNILANLIRILLLTMFHILPDNPFHEIMGTLCFLLYVIAPSYFIIKWIASITSKRNITIKETTVNFKKTIILNLLLTGTIMITGFLKLSKPNPPSLPLTMISLNGYSKKIINEDVLKFEKPGLLVYIKPLSRFYGAEHNPMICWIGSGYLFSRINIEIIDGKEIYTGILKNGNDIIYAAWWFDSGAYKTTSQIDWRWRALKGESFSLINVNSGSPALLKQEVKNLLKFNHLYPQS